MIHHLVHSLVHLWRETRGATAIEYGLIAALISIAAVTAMGNLGNKLGRTFGNVTTSMR